MGDTLGDRKAQLCSRTFSKAEMTRDRMSAGGTDMLLERSGAKTRLLEKCGGTSGCVVRSVQGLRASKSSSEVEESIVARCNWTSIGRPGGGVRVGDIGVAMVVVGC